MSSIAPPAHTRGEHTTDDWITPRWVIDKFGPFDLDPCASLTQPWPCARGYYTVNDDGLSKPWFDNFVYCNPPYGLATSKWLEKLALHNHGIALVFARTETKMFQKHVWPKASSILFLYGRLTFHYPDGRGSKAGHNSGGPSVLIGYGSLATERLMRGHDVGKFLRVN